MDTSVLSLLSQEKIPAILVNDKGFVTDINIAFSNAYGYTKDILVGKPLSTIIPENLQAAHHIGFSRFLNTEKPTLLKQPLQLAVQHASGAVLIAEHCIYAEKLDNQWVFAATIKLMDVK